MFETNENGINNNWKISVPRTIKITSIKAMTIAITKPGIKAVNELATPDGTDAGILIRQLCLIQKR